MDDIRKLFGASDLCSCGHPQSEHWNYEGSCSSCKCLKFKKRNRGVLAQENEGNLERKQKQSGASPQDTPSLNIKKLKGR